MRIVLRGVEPATGRAVALKLLLHATEREDLERVGREARTLEALRHPHITALLGTGREGAHPYLVLELLEGGSLAERLRRDGPLAPAEAVALFADLARALHHAHGHGVIHRDIKPANILFDAEGTAKLADFGLARREDLGETRLTRSGVILGTPSYMAP